MPSHIFTRVGAWTEPVVTNRRSADIAQRVDEPDDLDLFRAQSRSPSDRCRNLP
jgi:hypothetical protein